MRGLCTVLVTKSGAVEDCQSWRTQPRTRELPLAIVMLTLCRVQGVGVSAFQDPSLQTALPARRYAENECDMNETGRS